MNIDNIYFKPCFDLDHWSKFEQKTDIESYDIIDYMNIKDV